MGIKITNLTKDYGQGKGIFNINLNINTGETLGIVGINGAGKTTTLRELMGFIKPDRGQAIIDEKNAWSQAAELKGNIGYVPGEIAFPDTKTGQTFLHTQMSLLKMRDHRRVNQLIQRFKIDTTANIKRMSKGMKQKVALVAAFMNNPQILLLDEPTTGLDPVMRDTFIDLIKREKAAGKTIVMSSHMFNELEPTCDRIVFLKNGKIVEILNQEKIAKIHEYQRIKIAVNELAQAKSLLEKNFSSMKVDPNENMIILRLHESKTPYLLQLLKQLKLKDLIIEQEGLDNYFESELEGE